MIKLQKHLYLDERVVLSHINIVHDFMFSSILHSNIYLFQLSFPKSLGFFCKGILFMDISIRDKSMQYSSVMGLDD